MIQLFWLAGLYSFGLKHKGYNNVITGRDHKYGFGGKEYNDELGLDWYDVSARNYDPALGRWMNLDPLAEKMRRHSPYNFGFDNPIYFQDYDGMMPSQGDPIKKLKAAAKKADKLVVGIGRMVTTHLYNKAASIFGFEPTGGGDLRSDVSSGNGDQSLKRKGDRETPVYDVTGLDVATGFATTGKDGVNNNKGTSNNTNRKKGTGDGKDYGEKTAMAVTEKVVSTGEKMVDVYNSDSGTMNTETAAGESVKDTTFVVQTTDGVERNGTFGMSKVKDISVTVSNTRVKVDSTNTHHQNLVTEQHQGL